MDCGPAKVRLLAEQSIKFTEQGHQKLGLIATVKLSNRLRPYAASAWKFAVLIDNGLYAGDEHKLEPLRKGHRIHRKCLLEIALFVGQRLRVPHPDPAHFRFD